MRWRSSSSVGTRTSIAPARAAIASASRAVCSTSACGPSTSISSAAPMPGQRSSQSTPTALTAASIARRSIISIAAGTMPPPMISETQRPASSVDGNAARNVRVASGRRRMRSTTSVTTASVPSLPTSTPRRS